MRAGRPANAQPRRLAARPLLRPARRPHRAFTDERSPEYRRLRRARPRRGGRRRCRRTPWGSRVVVSMQRPGGQSQFSVRTHTPRAGQEMLRRVLDAVAEDPSAPHTLAAMACPAGVSTRHMTRLFHNETHTTPARYVEQVRMEAAQAMPEDSDDPMATVAPGAPASGHRSPCVGPSRATSASRREPTGHASDHAHRSRRRERPSPGGVRRARR
ncbi:helix-turn-helix domain-containing protein [Streptomyces sp. NPDC093260]|uniref:helix-turn-helix domain-containing protein n=1 Tax=Streptomyces sp. NPDC093260 TaxID=3155073 RepID=UPI0034176086